LVEDDLGWKVQTTAGSFRGKFLIGADGASSQVRKLLAPKTPLRFGLALETCIPTDSAGDYAMEFDFGPVDRGYGWVFPKHDHLNVGLYTLNPTLQNAWEKLQEFALLKTGKTITGPVHGHKIPHNGRAFRQRWDNACLVGDAAGLIDPFLGEGIYNAIRSGQLAADAIIRADGAVRADFSRAMSEITRDLASYDSETRRFYSNIKRGYRRLVRWPLGQLLVKGFAAGWTVGRIKRNLLILPLS
jgi:flavin-dependent dehydrogenase